MAVDHSDKKYHLKEMSDYPYTGSAIITKIPWTDYTDDKEEEIIKMEPTVTAVKERIEKMCSLRKTSDCDSSRS